MKRSGFHGFHAFTVFTASHFHSFHVFMVFTVSHFHGFHVFKVSGYSNLPCVVLHVHYSLNRFTCMGFLLLSKGRIPGPHDFASVSGLASQPVSGDTFIQELGNSHRIFGLKL